MATDLGERTIADFGRQWLSFKDSPGYYGSVEVLQDIFGPLLSVEELRGKRVAEIGSGAGRIVNMLLAAGATHVVAVEPSAAMTTLRDNTAAYSEQITYLALPGDSLPPGLELDVVVSIGVLHHIPDPAPVVRAVHRALRPGGRFLIWLYGKEGNEAYLRLALPLRRLTTHLPHCALVGLSGAISLALDAYILACRVLPLPMHRYMRNVVGKFPKSVRRLTVYDQLNPAFAKYYTETEARELLANGGFADVALYHRHSYSWTAIGRKPAARAAQTA